jgi:hypothetical protein
VLRCMRVLILLRPPYRRMQSQTAHLSLPLRPKPLSIALHLTTERCPIGEVEASPLTRRLGSGITTNESSIGDERPRNRTPADHADQVCRRFDSRASSCSGAAWDCPSCERRLGCPARTDVLLRKVAFPVTQSRSPRRGQRSKQVWTVQVASKDSVRLLL